MAMAKYFLLATVATLANAFTQPTTQCLGDCNSIFHPGLQEAVSAGAPFTVQWKPTTPGTVTILLYNGPSTNLRLVGPIAEKITNTGNFSWTPELSLKPDVTHYGLQIINDADGTFQWSTQFGISNPSYSDGNSSTMSTSPSSTAFNSTSVTPTLSSSTGAAGNSTTTVGSAEPTISSSIQSTLPSPASTSSVSSNKTTSSTPTKSSNSAERLGLNFGGTLIAIMGAVFML